MPTSAAVCSILEEAMLLALSLQGMPLSKAVPAAYRRCECLAFEIINNILRICRLINPMPLFWEGNQNADAKLCSPN